MLNAGGGPAAFIGIDVIADNACQQLHNVYVLL